MTAEEKTALACFLDLTGDYVNDGYARPRDTYAFEDDEPLAPLPQESAYGDLALLPLAYQVDEYADDAAPPDYETVGQAASGKSESLEELAAAVNTCKACGLAATRNRAVAGEGVSRPLVMIIGEGPGADEDASGRPFVGKAGQLLDKMLSSIGLLREKNCFIANMVKCRPPGNRDPEPDEIAACFPFLERQIKLLQPRLILCAGRVAAQNLLKTAQGINALRGSFAGYNPGGGETIPVLCTFHPSALLRDEALKRPAWEDLKLLKSRLDSLNEE